MNQNPVRWFEIYVSDMERAKKFYESVLGVSLEKLEAPDIELWSFPSNMSGPGASGALVKMPGFPIGGNSTLVYFGSANCALEESRVVKAGGRIQKPKTSIGQYGYIVLAYDTEGNMFGIHSTE